MLSTTANKGPEQMALNRREADMLDRYIRATHAARTALEPGPSWNKERRRAEALLAIEKACGGTPGSDKVYAEARRHLMAHKAQETQSR